MTVVTLAVITVTIVTMAIITVTIVTMAIIAVTIVTIARRSSTRPASSASTTTAGVRLRRSIILFHSPCILRVPDYACITAWNLRR
ncbi:hypothetical protein D3C87_1883800 [compost metagenome]